MEGPKLPNFRGNSESLEHQLCLAINNGDVKGVLSLLKQGAKANSTCLYGRTALGTACNAGKVEIVKILLQASLLLPSKQPLSSNKVYHENEQSYFKRESLTKDFHEWKRKDSGSSKKLKYRKPRFTNLENDGNCSEDEEFNEVNDDFPFSYTLQKLNQQLESLSVDQHLIEKPYSQRNSISDHINLGSSCSSQIKEDCTFLRQSRTEPNQGYFIVVHGEEDKDSDDFEIKSIDVNSNEPQTPDDMDSLEWDSDFQEKYNDDFEKKPDSDAWVDLYRWYADYLANSSAVCEPEKSETSVKIDIDQQDLYHWTAMHYAAEQGHLEIMRLLINAGCHVDIGDTDDVTPLHLAAAHDYPDAVYLLISNGTTVNRRSIDRTGPLHMAAARGFMETARVLLLHGASVNSLDRSDRTPLMLAAARGLTEMVDLLIRHGAKVNMEDINGYTALCQAVWQQERDLVHLLLSSGAKLTHSDRLLHYAILHRCVDVAHLLIEAGSVVNLRDDCGDTPLHIASRTGQVAVASLLLQNGAVVNYPNGITGNNPLHEAVESLRAAQSAELKQLLMLFLSHGARLNPKNSLEDDCLSRAHRYNNDRAVMLLIQYGADVSAFQIRNEIVSEWYLERHPEHFIIAQLMVHAGLNLWKFAQSITFDAEYPKDSPLLWIARQKFNPLSLVELSRLNIRRHFGELLYRVPSITSLPSRLKKIIMLEDVVFVD